MERPPENRKEESPKERYLDLINVYQGKVGELKRLQRRVPRGAVDEEIGTAIRVVDQERHETHLKLIELGRQLGKSKDDVLVDIIRKDGTLDEYGLPEFSILTEDDIIDTGDWHNPYYFNVDPDARRPSREAPDSYYKKGGESLIKSDEVMFVFAIVPIKNYGEDALDPEDYDERVKRAQALAEEVGGKIFEERDSGYHEAYAKILGVIVPKKGLEKVAATIRNNPNKYRIGNEFYSEQVKDGLELLRKAQSTIEEVTGVKSDLEKLPKPVEGAEILKEKTIVLIDDDRDVFESFIPHLMVATEGKAIFIAHGGQSEEEIIREISESGANVVLLDFHLSMRIEGTNIAKALKDSGFSGAIIGFSSDKTADQAFKKAGALGAINKNTNAPEVSIRKLAQVLSK